MTHYAPEVPKVSARLPVNLLTCDCCGEVNAVAAPWGDNLCPECVGKYALSNAAQDHMRALIRDALADWLHIWGQHPTIVRGMTDEVHLTVGSIAEDLLADMGLPVMEPSLTRSEDRKGEAA